MTGLDVPIVDVRPGEAAGCGLQADNASGAVATQPRPEGELTVPGCVDSLTGAGEALGRIEQRVAHLCEVLDARFLYDSAKEDAFNRLYAELDDERAKAAGEELRPLLRDLVRVVDHIEEALRCSPEAAEPLQTVFQALDEVLYRADVERVEASPGQPFDRATQAVRRVLETDDPERDWQVAESLAAGFRFKGRMLRPQQVVVRRLKVKVACDPAGSP